MIKDFLNGGNNKKINVSLFYHFSKGLTLSKSNKNYEGSHNNFNFKFETNFFSTSKIHYGDKNKLGWQVLSYGHKVPSCTIELNMLKSTTKFFETSLTIFKYVWNLWNSKF